MKVYTLLRFRDKVHHFLKSVDNLLGYSHTFNQLNLGNRVLKVDTFPMGIDYHKFCNAVFETDVKKEIKKTRFLLRFNTGIYTY